MNFRVATLNTRGIAALRRRIQLCCFLKEHEIDICFLQETNVMSLDDVGDLCHGYNAVVVPSTTTVGSGLACVFAAGVVVHRQHILWSGKMAVIDLTVRGVSMTCVNAHVSHAPEERCRQLQIIAVLAREQGAWILGDLNISVESAKDMASGSAKALAELLDQADLVDIATFFDAALEHTRVATIGSRVDARRLDRILLPSGFCDRVTQYQTIDYAYSDHRAVLIQVGDPSSTRLPCIRKLLRSELFVDRMEMFIGEIWVDLAKFFTSDVMGKMDQDQGKSGRGDRSLAPAVAESGGGCIERASHFLRRSLEDDTARSNYPSLSNLGRSLRARRRSPSTFTDDDGNAISGGQLRRFLLERLCSRFALDLSSEEAIADFLAEVTSLEFDEWDQLLLADISRGQIAAAIHRLLNGRASGWDGLPCEFVKAFEDSSPKRSKVILLPKVHGGPGLQAFRPISLPTTDYRVLSGVLMARLRRHLPDLVPQCQTYAVPGRSSSWNIARVCNETAALFSIGVGPLLRRLEMTLGRGNVAALADDIVLFIRDDAQFELVPLIFVEFRMSSGVAVNFTKSCLLWRGSWKHRTDSPLGISWTFESLTVLGCTITTRNTVASQASHLMGLLERAIARWSPFTRGLSLVGHARAANSLVLGSILHHLHGYLPPETTIGRLQARLARFVWGTSRVSWLPGRILACPVSDGGVGLLDIAGQLRLACLKGVQASLRGAANGYSWLVRSRAWLTPPVPDVWHSPRRRRLLSLWEAASSVLELDHRFLHPASLRPAGSRATVEDFSDGAPTLSRSTRAALLTAQHLGAFCQRVLRENASSSSHAEYEAETIVLQGSATSITRLTSQRARRALDSARLQEYPVAELAARWISTVDVPRSISWADLRRNCFSGHDADVALRLALHALPHPASRRATCAACGRAPLLREVFASCDFPLDLQAWLFGVGLHPEAVKLTSVAKATIYKYHLGLELGNASQHLDLPTLWERTLAADCPELDDQLPDGEDGIFTTVGGSKKRPHDPVHANSGTKKGCVQAPRIATKTSRPRATQRPSKVHECQTTRQKQATFRSRSAAGKADQCVYLEFCPDFTQEQYFRALEAKLGKGTVYQLTKMEGQILVGLSSVQQADKLVEDGLEIEDALLRATPLKKRAERIVIRNVPFFVENLDLVAALRPYGLITSIVQKMMRLGESYWADARREAFITLRDGVKLSHIPACLEINSKGVTSHVYVTYGIKCSLCYKHRHKRANCPRKTGVQEANLLLHLDPPAGPNNAGGRQLSSSNVMPAPVPTPAAGSTSTPAPIPDQHHPQHQQLQLHHQPHLQLLRLLQRPYLLLLSTNSLSIFPATYWTNLGSKGLKEKKYDLESLKNKIGSEQITALNNTAQELIDALPDSNCALYKRLSDVRDQHLVAGRHTTSVSGLRRRHRAPAALRGLGLACLFAPGVAVLRQRVLWPGNISIVSIDVRGQEVRVINCHLSHNPRERLEQVESIKAAAIQEDACVVGDRNIDDQSTSDTASGSVEALMELMEQTALVDVATLFDGAHLSTRVASCRRRVDTARLDRILLPSRLLERVTLYKTIYYKLSDHRAVLVQLGSPPLPSPALCGRYASFGAAADYPSLPDLVRSLCVRRPACTNIRDEDGSIIEGGELRRLAYSIYQRRFARQPSDPIAAAEFIRGTTTPLTLEEDDPLIRPVITGAEIAAIRRLPLGRAPGWDDFPCEFLIAYEDFFVEALRRVFEASKRLRPHLPVLVPQCQTYAVPGRSPSWNVARIADEIHVATRNGSELAVISTDLESAFDTLYRSFLVSLMVFLRLPPAFIEWFLLLYAGADAAVRARGLHTRPFHLLNGVKQGCAVSAALFSLATGPLLVRLERALGPGNVLAYADDIVLLNRRDELFDVVRNIFEDFRRASGIDVNFAKSRGLWCGAWRARTDAQLGISWTSEQLRVLGCNVTSAMSSSAQEQHLLALLEGAITRWVPFTRGLSLVGRARAANSPVLSAVVHHLHGYLPTDSTIAKLQARLMRFVWGPQHTAWLPGGVLARPVSVGGLGLLDIGIQLCLACLKGVQAALRGSLNAYSWLAVSGTLLRLWEAVSEILELNHRVLPPHQLQKLHVIGYCRFLRPPDLLVASRWAGLRVGDITSSSSLPLRTTRATLADVAALTTFCSQLVEQNRNHTHRVDNIENAIVLRGMATPLQRLTTRTARRMLERPRLAALLITQLLGRWLPHVSIPISISWSSLRRGAYSGHNADVAVRLALHALPHPAHPASARESCIACGRIRPVIVEAFTIIQRPPDLQSWIFGRDLEDNALAIMASAKTRIYKYFLALELRGSKKTLSWSGRGPYRDGGAFRTHK
ncbi:hypothetical protein LAZ67_11002528 [Cordylochernes scorpioides]|uniref:Reverse transcriptase domain-containing protein n=1 Tax=Cordylochernes scorpioides TaxID=51811 RepID=A0ABY6L155_9ARAC|nr:hypothetical protein LAZ67_11002528 [Cordylochernes scorpioides]